MKGLYPPCSGGMCAGEGGKGDVGMLSKNKLSGIKKIHQKKFREEEGAFLVEGWKSVEEGLNAGIEFSDVIIEESKREDSSFSTLISKLQSRGSEVCFVKPKVIESISDTITSQGIVAVAKKRDSGKTISSVLAQPAALVVALDSINDPGNLGTIIRTCDWFGVDALVIGKNSVELYNPKVIRATMGSMFHLPIADNVHLPDFLSQSRKENYKIFSSELSDSEDLRSVTVGKKSIIVIGSESHGVSEEISRLADRRISIPKFGHAESLNAAMACGIILSSIKLK